MSVRFQATQFQVQSAMKDDSEDTRQARRLVRTVAENLKPMMADARDLSLQPEIIHRVRAILPS
jgi:hypothetical protein